MWWMRLSLHSLATPYWIRHFSDRKISQSWRFSEQPSLIFSPCCNSRLQNEPWVICRWVHRSTCCHFLHLSLFSPLSLSLFFFLSSPNLSLSPHLMLWVPSWLLLILSHWFSFYSPASLHLQYSVNDWHSPTSFSFSASLFLLLLSYSLLSYYTIFLLLSPSLPGK